MKPESVVHVMGSHCLFLFVWYPSSSFQEGGGKGEEKKERREETQAGHPVCVLWLKKDGKHFYHDSAILDTDTLISFHLFS